MYMYMYVYVYVHIYICICIYVLHCWRKIKRSTSTLAAEETDFEADELCCGQNLCTVTYSTHCTVLYSSCRLFSIKPCSVRHVIDNLEYTYTERVGTQYSTTVVNTYCTSICTVQRSVLKSTE